MQTIGLLLPRSSYYNTINFDLYEGFLHGLQKLGRNDIKIVTENIGFGADKQLCYRAAEKLLMDENATIVVAYIGHRMAQLLRPLFLAANKILIVLDAGSNLPHEWPECPNIFYHSLNNSLGAWLTSKMAAENGHTLGGMVTGYYDGGYLQTLGLFNGYQAAGGTIRFNHATGYKKEEFTMLPLKNHLEQFPGSSLLSLFSGDYVHWYFSEIKEHFSGNNIPIYLPPFAFEETMLKEAVYPENPVKGITAWSKSISNPENTAFIESLEAIGRTPNLFSLLSWEGAEIAAKAIDLYSEYKGNVAAINPVLHLFEFESPRGCIKFHPKTNTTIAPLYEASLIADEKGMCEVKLGKTVLSTTEDFEKLTQQPLENITSSWFNSYTCI
ncbi:ABC transporter substrate-binding protein [Flavobacterium pedocola]